jgi:hypothetical protein
MRVLEARRQERSAYRRREGAQLAVMIRGFMRKPLFGVREGNRKR